MPHHSDSARSAHAMPHGAKTPGDIRALLRVTWGGLFVNLALFAIKLAAGLAAGSRAVVADAVHSLTDLSTDIAILAGARFWSAPPDEDHPYGHGRIETIITVCIGMVLALVGLGIVRDAFLSPSTQSSLPAANGETVGWIASAAAGLSIVIKEIVFRWTRKVATRIQSQALLANAWHHRSDAISSIPALLAASAAAVSPDLWWVDRAGAVVVSLFVLKAAIDIAWPALAQLADRGAGPDMVKRLTDLACDVEGVLGVHALRSRFLGSHLIVDLHVEVNPAITVAQGHDIAEAVEKVLVGQEPRVMEVIVHVEPYPERPAAVSDRSNCQENPL